MCFQSVQLVFYPCKATFAVRGKLRQALLNPGQLRAHLPYCGLGCRHRSSTVVDPEQQGFGFRQPRLEPPQLRRRLRGLGLALLERSERYFKVRKLLPHLTELRSRPGAPQPCEDQREFIAVDGSLTPEEAIGKPCDDTQVG